MLGRQWRKLQLHRAVWWRKPLAQPVWHWQTHKGSHTKSLEANQNESSYGSEGAPCRQRQEEESRVPRGARKQAENQILESATERPLWASGSTGRGPEGHCGHLGAQAGALKAASLSLGEPSQGLDTRSTAGQETCIHSQTVLEVETCCRRDAGSNRGQDLVVPGGEGGCFKNTQSGLYRRSRIDSWVDASGGHSPNSMLF